MELTTEIREAIDASVLCWLATVGPDGAPNVSPKEVFLADGDEVVIAHIASPTSVANIAGDPRVCISLIDVFEQRGWKLRGTATLVEPGAEGFPRLLALLETLTDGRYPVRAAIRVAVTDAEPIVAPSYRLYPDVPDAERRRATLATYGVVDAPRADA